MPPTTTLHAVLLALLLVSAAGDHSGNGRDDNHGRGNDTRPQKSPPARPGRPSPRPSPVPSPRTAPPADVRAPPVKKTVSSLLFQGGSLSIKPSCTVDTCLTTNNVSNHLAYITKAYRSAGLHPDTHIQKLCINHEDIKCLSNTQIKNITHYSTNSTTFQVSDTAQDFNRTGFTVGSGNSIQFANAKSHFNSGRWVWQQPGNEASMVKSDVAFQSYKCDLKGGAAYFEDSSAWWNNTGFELTDTLLGAYNSNLTFLGTGIRISATNGSEHPGVYMVDSTIFVRSVSLTISGVTPVWLQGSKLVLVNALLTLEAGTKMFITDGMLYMHNSRIVLKDRDTQLHLWSKTRIHGDKMRGKRWMSSGAENILWDNSSLIWLSNV